MREIKFRAWDTLLKELLPNVQNHINDDYWSFGAMIRSERWVVQQFTGRKDKDGKEIYEGDVVKLHYFYEALGEGLGVFEAEKEIIGHISFQELGLWIEGSNEEESGYLLLFPKLHEEGLEVIGNIYENPELLKELSK